MSVPHDLRTFEQFWPHYVAEHRNPGCRALHYVALVAAIAVAAWAVLSGTWWGLALALVVAYGLAWVSHFFVECNQPATWRYPWWSIRGELRMFRLFVTGRMGREVERLELAETKTGAPEAAGRG